MSNLILIDPTQDPRWDEFVMSHPFGWICHLSGWKRALEKTFKHMQGHYLVLLDDQGETIKAGLPLFEVNSKLTGNRLVSIPFASLCDPLVATKVEFTTLLNGVFELFEKQRGSHLEIRGFASSSLVSELQLSRSDHYCVHDVDLNVDLDQLMKSFHKSSVRLRIKKAIKNDLNLVVGAEEKDLKVFYRLLLKTRKRIGRPIMPYRFFKNLWNEFFDDGLLSLLLAEKDGIPIAGLLVLRFRDRVSQEFAGSDYEYRKWCGEHFLTWESIRFSKKLGYKVLDFGRTGYDNPGLVEHKGRWGAKEITLSNFYYPKDLVEEVGNQEDSWKFKLIQKLCHKGPECVQPLLGEFCYRHMG